MKNQKTAYRYLCTFKHIGRIVETAAPFIAINLFLVVLLLLLATTHPAIATSNPTIPPGRLTAFRRAKSLDNGVSFSWLEQTWNKDALAEDHLNNADLLLLKKLGFKSIRLPVAFEYYENE